MGLKKLRNGIHNRRRSGIVRILLKSLLFWIHIKLGNMDLIKICEKM